MVPYEFRNIMLYKQALCHPSKGGENFELLEFLGDRVLNLVLVLLLMEIEGKKIKNNNNIKKDVGLRSTPSSHIDTSSLHIDYKVNEGDMARRLARLSSAPVLKEIALSWRLDQLLVCTLAQRAHLLADACEAMIGAIFLDCGSLEIVKKLINQSWNEHLKIDYIDHKTHLQELAHKMGKVPVYEVIKASGQVHKPLFDVKVSVGVRYAFGKGNSKKEAEKDAAKALLELFE